MLEDAVKLSGEIPAVQPRDRIYDSSLIVIGGGLEGILRMVAGLVAEEFVVYFARVADATLGFAATDYAAPDYG